MRTGILVILFILVLAFLTVLAWVQLQHGFSTRTEPSILERALAVALRRAAVPVGGRQAANPVSASPEVLAEARAHFADHCAACHANNGSGDTPLGRGLYPRAPDMRQAGTQSLTDGELYWLIHNGIRLSGMPAWGDPDHDDDSWKLVLFVRHLPSMTREEESAMEEFNPKGRAEMEQEDRDRRFLAGENDPPVSTHTGRKSP
jgi:mono/diheme cytochrome c family protein